MEATRLVRIWARRARGDIVTRTCTQPTCIAPPRGAYALRIIFTGQRRRTPAATTAAMRQSHPGPATADAPPAAGGRGGARGAAAPGGEDGAGRAGGVQGLRAGWLAG
jgi:hypothetical protein